MPEYYPCVIVKVYVDGCVQLCDDGDPERGHHCGKGEYVREGFLVKENFKGSIF